MDKKLIKGALFQIKISNCYFYIDLDTTKMFDKNEKEVAPRKLLTELDVAFKLLMFKLSCDMVCDPLFCNLWELDRSEMDGKEFDMSYAEKILDGVENTNSIAQKVWMAKDIDQYPIFAFAHGKDGPPHLKIQNTQTIVFVGSIEEMCFEYEDSTYYTAEDLIDYILSDVSGPSAAVSKAMESVFILLIFNYIHGHYS